MLDPKPQSFYVKELKQYIPKEAFAPATYKLVPMFAHAFFIMICITGIHVLDSLLAAIGLSVFVGVSITCIFLYAHELTHGTIIRKQPLLYLLQNFFWAFVGIPPTVWKRVHNLSHHHHMNTYDDPDRKTFKSEKNWINSAYNLFIYPNKVLRYSFSVAFAMIFYATKHILAVFYSGDTKPSIVTYRPDYTKAEVRRVAFELLYIIGFWMAIAAFIGFPYAPIVLAVAWCTYSSLAITLIITQHLKDDHFIDIADPLLTSTSVKLPKWLDKLIDWHSFHVEHHLFPGLNFDYYPQLSQRIEEHFPDRYQRMSVVKAIKECYSKDVFIDDPMI